MIGNECRFAEAEIPTCSNPGMLAFATQMAEVSMQVGAARDASEYDTKLVAALNRLPTSGRDR